MPLVAHRGVPQDDSDEHQDVLAARVRTSVARERASSRRVDASARVAVLGTYLGFAVQKATGMIVGSMALLELADPSFVSANLDPLHCAAVAVLFLFGRDIFDLVAVPSSEPDDTEGGDP